VRFNGEGDVEAYIASLQDHIAAGYPNNPNDALRHLPYTFDKKSIGEKWYMTYRLTFTSMEDFYRKLRVRFAPRESDHFAEMEFANVYQQENETAAVYIDRKLEVLHKSGVPTMAPRTILWNLYYGLLAKYHTEIKMDTLRDEWALQQACYATEQQWTVGAVMAAGRARQQPPPAKEPPRRNPTAATQPAATPAAAATSDRRPVCYHCQKSGHKARLMLYSP